jgi:hypothetical protein
VDPRAIVRLEGFGKLKKKKYTSPGARTRDLPACSIVPQPTTLPRAPIIIMIIIIRAIMTATACKLLGRKLGLVSYSLHVFFLPAKY